jgi:hypothetical protein
VHDRRVRLIKEELILDPYLRIRPYIDLFLLTLEFHSTNQLAAALPRATTVAVAVAPQVALQGRQLESMSVAALRAL